MHHHFHPSHIKEEMKMAPYRDHERCSESASNERLILSLIWSLQAATAWFLPSPPSPLSGDAGGCGSAAALCLPGVFDSHTHCGGWVPGGGRGAAIPHLADWYLGGWAMLVPTRGGHVLTPCLGGFCSSFWSQLPLSPMARCYGSVTSGWKGLGARSIFLQRGSDHPLQGREEGEYCHCIMEKAEVCWSKHLRERRILPGFRCFHQDCGQEQEVQPGPPLGAPSLHWEQQWERCHCPTANSSRWDESPAHRAVSDQMAFPEKFLWVSKVQKDHWLHYSVSLKTSVLREEGENERQREV